MTTYLLRRLLLMIPTVIGITFIVFMLVALSPGGIGAGLRFEGGAAESSARAQQEAYLEDRYGLNDPVIVQYLRWLHRVSPVKFGRRDQVDPRGVLVRSPAELEAPPLVREWFGAGSNRPHAGAPLLLPADPAERDAAWRAASRAYAAARGEYAAARARLEESIREYARESKLSNAFAQDGKLDLDMLGRHVPDRVSSAFAAAQTRADEAWAAYASAVEARGRLEAMFRAKPYPEAGVPIIPGVLSIASPDLGVAFSRSQPVGELIGEALPVTLLLNAIAFPIIYLVAVPSGVIAAARRGSWFDVLSGAVFAALWSAPTVVAGVLMLGFLAGGRDGGWFPPGGLSAPGAEWFAFLPSIDESGAFRRGWLLDRLWHVALPVTCLVYGGFAVLARQTRAAVLDQMNADYARTARAKGAPERAVVWRHVLRNSLLPVVTLFATIFPAMLAGSVVVERIFSIPGMGSLMLDAIAQRDRELLLANALMIGVVNVAAQLGADIAYALLDPRIRHA